MGRPTNDPPLRDSLNENRDIISRFIDAAFPPKIANRLKDYLFGPNPPKDVPDLKRLLKLALQGLSTKQAVHILKTIVQMNFKEVKIITIVIQETVEILCLKMGKEAMTITLRNTFIQVTEKSTDKVVSSTVKETVARLTKETTEEIATTTFKKAAMQITKETTEETASKVASVTLGKKLTNVACRHAGLIVSVVVEGAFLAYDVQHDWNKVKTGELSKEAFRRNTVQRTGAAGGSLTCSIAGGYIGTFLIPVPIVGSFVGTVVGGVVGNFIGSKFGEKADNIAFGGQ